MDYGGKEKKCKKEKEYGKGKRKNKRRKTPSQLLELVQVSMGIHMVCKLLLAVSQLITIIKRDGFCIRGLASNVSISKGPPAKGSASERWHSASGVWHPCCPKFGVPILWDCFWRSRFGISDLLQRFGILRYDTADLQGYSWCQRFDVPNLQSFEFLASKVWYFRRLRSFLPHVV